jgi:hypothetical protein
MSRLRGLAEMAAATMMAKGYNHNSKSVVVCSVDL